MKMKKTIAGLLTAVTLVSSVAGSSFAATTKFTDVSSDAWYATAVNSVAAHGLVDGIGNNKFGPDLRMTRAQVAQILYNMEGRPSVSGSSAFTDVKSGAWYYNAVQWASQNKIVYGIGNGKFSPDESVTREQFAAFLFRYLGNEDPSTLEYQVLEKFDDGASVSSWAWADMAWAVDKGIINGTNTNKLLPKSTATRAQGAQMLDSVIEYVTLGHKYVLTNIVAATDTADGKNEYTCSICNKIKTEVIPATGDINQDDHDYTSAITQEATCTEPGIITYTCSICGDTYTEVIPATGHDYEIEVTTEATETTPGVRTYTCKNCGYAYTESIPATGEDHTHSYTAAVTKSATCTEDGVKTYTCSCGDSYTETIKATGHDYTITTSNGVTVYTCKNCGDSYAADESSNEHNWVASQTGWIVDQEAYDEPVITGYRLYYLCHGCGAKFYFDQYEENENDTSPGQYNAAHAINNHMFDDCTGEGGYGPTTGAYSLQKEPIYGDPIHHDEVGHYGTTEYTCSKCGETVDYKAFMQGNFSEECNG